MADTIEDGAMGAALNGARYIALIRHGEYQQQPNTPSALQPFPLTENGELQAESCGAELAELLCQNSFRLAPVLHCSHQLRAWQTADRIADVLRRSGHAVDGLSETAALSERSVGAVANLSLSQIEALLQLDPRYETPPKGWKSDSAYRLPFQGAESLLDAGARVAAHLQSVARVAQPDSLTLCVGHGASFRHAAHHLGVLERAEIADLSMFHARPLLLCYTRAGIWSHFGGAWKQRQRQEMHLD